MNRLTVTTPITDLDNVSFVRFGGRLETGEKNIESAEDIMSSMIPMRETMNTDKERKYFCPFSGA